MSNVRQHEYHKDLPTPKTHLVAVEAAELPCYASSADQKARRMKRDLDLVRRLVLAVEDLPTGTALADLEIEGYTPEQIGYHSYLSIDAGLAQGIDVQSLSDTSPNWQILHLTSAGHDFADAARSETTWNRAKELVVSKGGGATLEVVKQVLVAVIKQGLGI